MKSKSYLLSVIVICFFLTTVHASEKYSGGTGEPNDPYKIATAQDLIDLGNEPNDYFKHFVQDANIDLSGYVFDSALIAFDTNEIGYNGQYFTGTFDGQGYIIKNLHIQGQDYLGMFGQIDSAVLLNIALENTDVNGTGYNIGSLVGYNRGSIRLCYNDGVVRGNNAVGGLAGGNSGKIILSYNTGAVESDNTAGGLAGSNSGGSIISCYNSGVISGYFYVGGVAGSNYEGNIIRSYNIGQIKRGTQYVGGLVGANCNPRIGCGIVTSSFWDIQTSGKSSSDGGIGLTTAQMQDVNNYLNAGWDFVGEQSNGTSNFWFIQENNYPQLTAFSEDAIYELQGSGTTDDPYLIYDANDLGTIWYRPAAHYRLEADINLSDIMWNQAIVPWLEGSFNGNSHIIQSLHIEGYNRLGLFGELYENAEISNLTLESVDINGIGDYVGSLAGHSYRNNITECQSNGTVIGNDCVGGLVGYNFGYITSCSSNCTVIGNDYVGGLVGYNPMIISSCFSTGITIGNNYIGGLIGYNMSRIGIKTNYSSGMVSGINYIGGLVGGNFGSGGIITCYSTGKVNGIDYFGGLVGYSRVDIKSSFWDTETSGLSTSEGGTGKTTAEMQDINTFLDAGWDFFGETDNGSEDIWWIDNGQDYPRLWWEMETDN